MSRRPPTLLTGFNSAVCPFFHPLIFYPQARTLRVDMLPGISPDCTAVGPWSTFYVDPSVQSSAGTQK